MIMQTAIYWLCHAMLLVLCAEEFEPRRLELLAKRQLHLVEKGLAIAESINSYTDRLAKEKDDKLDFTLLAPAFRSYATLLYTAFQALKDIDNRALILASVADDPALKDKILFLARDMAIFLDSLPPMGWDKPLSCELAVSKRCRIVNCATPSHWDLFPNYAWGCFNLYDKSWVEDEVARTAEGEKCFYVHPAQLMCKLNMPNYFLWACALSACKDANEAALMEIELARALCSYVSEEDKGSLEDNSTTPAEDQWAPVAGLLPAGVLLPVIPVKTRETRWDVMAGKEQVTNVQMLLMQLVPTE